MILAGGRVDELSILTLERPKSAVPFGGIYRVIDFALSNLMHSGIERVGILTHYRSDSLSNHIGIGTSWDMAGRRRGVISLPPKIDAMGFQEYKGTSDAVRRNLDFVKANDPELVLILSGDHVYRMDYRQMAEFHQQNDADMTIAFTEVPEQGAHFFGQGLIDESGGEQGGRIIRYWEKPGTLKSNWASLTIYLFKPRVLFEVLEGKASAGMLHFGRDVIPMLLKKYRVFGFKYKGYWGYTRTLEQYWRTNMDLIKEKPEINLDDWDVRTNLENKQIPERLPAVLAPGCSVQKSLFYSGCKIRGKVRSSILFPGVVVEEGAEVVDSILYYDCIVRRRAKLRQTILDECAEVGEGAIVGAEDKEWKSLQEGAETFDHGITLIGKNARIKPGLRIGRGVVIYPENDLRDFEESAIPSGGSII